MSDQEMTWPKTVYSVGDCPVGCGGDDLFVLRSRSNRELFLFCCWCGVAYRPGAVNLDQLLTPADLAPDGIEIPGKAEFLEALGATSVCEHPFEVDNFWYEVARTHLVCGQARAALAIVDRVIATWAQPPSTAYELRDQVLRAIKTPPS